MLKASRMNSISYKIFEIHVFLIAIDTSCMLHFLKNDSLKLGLIMHT